MADGTCQAPNCSRTLPPRRRRFCSDLCCRRGQAAERVTETAEYGRAVIRLIRAMSVRFTDPHIDEFSLCWGAMQEAEKAAAEAITRLRASGFSWARSGAEVGKSRQDIQQWHSRRVGVNGALTDDGPPDGAS